MTDYYLQPEVQASLSTIDPEFKEAFEANGPVNYGTTGNDPVSMREKSAQSMQHIVGDVSASRTQTIPMRDGYESELRVYSPPSGTVRSPLLVLFFGGGFIVGDNRQLNAYAKAACKLYGATVVCPSYRLAPEHRFPTGHLDAWDTLRWLAVNAPSAFGVDLSAGFVVGGVSAGAALTAITTQKAVSGGLTPSPTGMWLAIPGFLDESMVPPEYRPFFKSREQNANAPGFNADTVRRMRAALGPDFHSPDWSPFNAPSPHAGLPPAFVQVCGLDTLRDDGLIYEKALRDHGVATRLEVYSGVPHGFYIATPNIASGKKWDLDVILGLGWLLGRSAASTGEIEVALQERFDP